MYENWTMAYFFVFELSSITLLNSFIFEKGSDGLSGLQRLSNNVVNSSQTNQQPNNHKTSPAFEVRLCCISAVHSRL